MAHIRSRGEGARVSDQGHRQPQGLACVTRPCSVFLVKRTATTDRFVVVPDESRERAEIAEDAEKTQSEAKALIEKIEGAAEGSEEHDFPQGAGRGTGGRTHGLADRDGRAQGNRGEGRDEGADHHPYRGDRGACASPAASSSSPARPMRARSRPRAPTPTRRTRSSRTFATPKQGNQKAFDRIIEATEAAGLRHQGDGRGHRLRRWLPGRPGGQRRAGPAAHLRHPAPPAVLQRQRHQRHTPDSASRRPVSPPRGQTSWRRRPRADFTFGQISVIELHRRRPRGRVEPAPRRRPPGIDGLITTDLAKRLAILEEKAFVNGTGTGQPRGILNTSGINADHLHGRDADGPGAAPATS